MFLATGECQILRRIGGEIGNCMYLCVHEYDEFATPAQPLLKNVKVIRDNNNNQENFKSIIELDED